MDGERAFRFSKKKPFFATFISLTLGGCSFRFGSYAREEPTSENSSESPRILRLEDLKSVAHIVDDIWRNN